MTDDFIQNNDQSQTGALKTNSIAAKPDRI
jgi:hypothetical protein